MSKAHSLGEEGSAGNEESCEAAGLGAQDSEVV